MKARVYANAVKRLDRERGVLDFLNTQGRKVQQLAITRAPARTGRYAGSIRLRRAREARPMATVIAEDPKSMWLEYGTGVPAPSPHFEVLTRATNRVGFDLVIYTVHVRKGRRG